MQPPPPAGWLIGTEMPATVTLAERALPEFAEAVRVTLAVPKPEVAEAVIQPGRLIMVQAQPAAVEIIMSPEPPVLVNVRLVGLIE